MSQFSEMPSTDGVPFQREPIPEGLGMTDEIFVLVATNEIFTDYARYFARIITLNSHVWTCVVTGRSGLTYDEAVVSEARAVEEEAKVAEIIAAINNPPSHRALVALQSRLIAHMAEVVGGVEEEEQAEDVLESEPSEEEEVGKQGGVKVAEEGGGEEEEQAEEVLEGEPSEVGEVAKQGGIEEEEQAEHGGVAEVLEGDPSLAVKINRSGGEGRSLKGPHRHNAGSVEVQEGGEELEQVEEEQVETGGEGGGGRWRRRLADREADNIWVEGWRNEEVGGNEFGGEEEEVTAREVEEEAGEEGDNSINLDDPEAVLDDQQVEDEVEDKARDEEKVKAEAEEIVVLVERPLSYGPHLPTSTLEKPPYCHFSTRPDVLGKVVCELGRGDGIGAAGLCGAKVQKEVRALRAHLTAQHSPKPEFECRYCDSKFQFQSHLDKHNQRHTAERLLCALGCDSFVKPRCLFQHSRSKVHTNFCLHLTINVGKVAKREARRVAESLIGGLRLNNFSLEDQPDGWKVAKGCLGLPNNAMELTAMLEVLELPFIKHSITN